MSPGTRRRRGTTVGSKHEREGAVGTCTDRAPPVRGFTPLFKPGSGRRLSHHIHLSLPPFLDLIFALFRSLDVLSGHEILDMSSTGFLEL